MDKLLDELIKAKEEQRRHGPRIFTATFGFRTRSKRSKPTSDRAKLLRIREAAEYLNTSVWKLRQLVTMGKISFVQFGPSTSPMFFTRESLDKLIRDREELV